MSMKNHVIACTGILVISLLHAPCSIAATNDLDGLRGPIDPNVDLSKPNVDLSTRAHGDLSKPGTKPETPMGGLTAPTADAVMTPDMLLVSPKNADQKPAEPLKAYIGTTVALQVQRYDVDYDKLKGILVSVTNETNRPLVIDGNRAEASIAGKTTTAAPVTVLQQIVIPPHKVLEDILTKLLPAAATVGAIPTYKDYMLNRKPINERYGADELRRRLEAARFGRRILWPQQKSTGVVFFDTAESLDGAALQIPAMTLYDLKDSGVLTASGQAPSHPPVTTTEKNKSKKNIVPPPSGSTTIP
jgi:hypothetical protein